MNEYNLIVLVKDSSKKVIDELSFTITSRSWVHANLEALEQAKKNVAMRDGGENLTCEMKHSIIDYI